MSLRFGPYKITGRTADDGRKQIRAGHGFQSKGAALR
jgi:hypothetical protein